jgi:hypothetical protein
MHFRSGALNLRACSCWDRKAMTPTFTIFSRLSVAPELQPLRITALYIAQAGFELLGSSNLIASAFQVAGSTGLVFPRP